MGTKSQLSHFRRITGITCILLALILATPAVAAEIYISRPGAGAAPRRTRRPRCSPALDMAEASAESDTLDSAGRDVPDHERAVPLQRHPE